MHQPTHFSNLTYAEKKCMVPAFETPRTRWCDCTKCQSMAETMISMDRVFEELLGYKPREDVSVAFWDERWGEVCPDYVARELVRMGARQVQKEKKKPKGVAFCSEIQEEQAKMMFGMVVYVVVLVEILMLAGKYVFSPGDSDRQYTM